MRRETKICPWLKTLGSTDTVSVEEKIIEKKKTRQNKNRKDSMAGAAQQSGEGSDFPLLICYWGVQPIGLFYNSTSNNTGSWTRPLMREFGRG